MATQQLELQLDDKQSLLMQIQRLEAIVNDYRNRMPCSKKERKTIRMQGKAKVISLLGEPQSESYKTGYRLMFTTLWGTVKEHFNVKTLDEILEIHFTPAIHYINDWQPPKAIEPPHPCTLCEEEAGTIEIEGVKICGNCAQELGELFQ